MGQARLYWQLPPARWMLKAGSGQREGKRRPRSRDGASKSSIRWKHHLWWGLASLHPEEPLLGPLGDQRISTWGPGSPTLPQGCPGRETAAADTPARCPRKPDTQDTADLSPCQLAARGLLGDHAPADNFPAPPCLLRAGAERLALPAMHVPLGCAGWSHRQWEGRGSG